MENLKNIQPIEDFNWDALEKGDSYGEVSKDDLVKTYDETLNTVKDKEVVMGTVTAMNKREVVVNIGFKSDGVVSMAEFRYNPDLKIGDEVEVYIENQEDKKGQLILSHKKARATRSCLFGRRNYNRRRNYKPKTMGLFLQHKTVDMQWSVWKMEESLDTLFSLLPDVRRVSCEQEMQSFTSDRRKLE